MTSSTLPSAGTVDRMLVAVLGASLRHARLEQERTLEEVARAANCSYAYLSQLELGSKLGPSLRVLIAICKALNTTCSAMLLDIASRGTSVQKDALELAVVVKFFEEFEEFAPHFINQARLQMKNPHSWQLLETPLVEEAEVKGVRRLRKPRRPKVGLKRSRLGDS